MSFEPIRVERPSAIPGRVFAVRWECSSCHGKIDRTDRFCRHCGEQVASR